MNKICDGLYAYLDLKYVVLQVEEWMLFLCSISICNSGNLKYFIRINSGTPEMYFHGDACSLFNGCALPLCDMCCRMLRLFSLPYN